MSDEPLLWDVQEGDDENGVDHQLEVSTFERLVREVEADPGCASFPRLAEAYRRDGQVDRARLIAQAGLAVAPERLVGRVVLALALLDAGEVVDAIEGLATILEDVPVIRGEAAAASAIETKGESGVDFDSDTVIEQGSEPEPGENSFEHRLYSTAFSPPPATPLALPAENLPHVELDREGDNSAVALGEDEIDHAFREARAEAEPMLSPDDVVEAAVLDADILDTLEEEVVAAPAYVADDLQEPYRPADRPVFATETMATLLEGQGDVEAAQAIRSSMPDVSLESYHETFLYGSGWQSDAMAGPAGDAEAVEASAVGTELIETEPPTVESFASPSQLERHDQLFPASSTVERISFEATDEIMASIAGAPEAQRVALEVTSSVIPDVISETDTGAEQDVDDARTENRVRIVSRLESWLENIRRDAV
jgi:hypothetical protein